MKRCATYARVSSAEQVENTSLDNQATKLDALADQMGLTVARRYVDPGHSGAKRDRPGLTQLLTDAQAGLFDVVLVYRLDRLARSTYLAYSIIQELADLGVGVRSASEPQIDSTTPMGRMSLGVTAVFAELERDIFMQRSREGTRRAVERGQYAGGMVAYGYTVEDKRLVIHPEEAEVVRMIFGWCVERGWSTVRIAQELTRLGVPTRYRRDGRGVRGKATAQFWRAPAVVKMLHNPTYKGEYVYGKRTEGGRRASDAPRALTSCPPIVSPEVWQAAQEQIRRNARAASRNSNFPYMLRGLIVCERCGSSFTGITQRYGRYYRCGSAQFRRATTPAAAPCPARYIRADAIEPLIWEHLTAILTGPEEAVNATPSILPPELPRVEKALEQNRTARSRLTDLYLDGGMGKPEYLSRKESLEAQGAELEARAANLRDEGAQTAAREQRRRTVRTLAGRYGPGLATADDLTRQEVAQHLVRRVTVRADDSLDVEYLV